MYICVVKTMDNSYFANPCSFADGMYKIIKPTLIHNHQYYSYTYLIGIIFTIAQFHSGTRSKIRNGKRQKFRTFVIRTGAFAKKHIYVAIYSCQ